VSTFKINARDAAKALNLDLLDLSLILRKRAEEHLEMAARMAGKVDGIPDGVIAKAQHLVTAARACETAYDEDHPDEPEE